MDNELKEALARAKKRLKDAKPAINKRHDEGNKNSTEEPDELKSGYRNVLKRRRVIKDQKMTSSPDKEKAIKEEKK